MKQTELYETIGGEIKSTKHKKLNPMVKAQGPGPADKRCKHCAHCFSKSFSKTYYKCEFRGDTAGPGTDHRANWPTCSRFKEKTE